MIGTSRTRPASLFSQPVKKEKAAIGFIGIGLRGCNHLKNLLQQKDVLIPAICDIDPARINIARSMVTKGWFFCGKCICGDGKEGRSGKIKDK